MDKEEGLILLFDVIKKNKEHQDYKRVTELADKYFKMFTGKDIVELLMRITSRVTEEEFEQLKKIYKSNIPSTLNTTMLPFQKVCRKQPLMRELKYESGEDKRVLELENFINTYWGDKSVEEYLEYVFVDYNYHDPNAFLITEFDEFNPDKEKASPYPFIVTSAEAIMFEYENEILQYLIIRLPIKYIDGDVEKEGFKFTMYLGYDTIQLTQVAKKDLVDASGNLIDTEYLEINDKIFRLEYFEPKDDKVPARRLGFKRDAETAGRTFVSLFHPVLLLIEKGIKTDSELDLSMSLTAFPRRYAYVDKCSGRDCNMGQRPNGELCPVCKGTGKEPLHNSTMDVVTLPLPKNPEEMLDLNNLMVTQGVPTDLLQFMSDYEDKICRQIYSKMFNAEIFSQSEVQVAVTATEKILETDNMNDTLYPFARSYSALWEFVVLDIATFTDLSEGLTVHHKFPNDFKFKSLTELMTELKTAKDAQASTSTITAIEDDINEILYSDRPNDLKKIKIKNMINPFRGYDESDVRLIIAQGKTTEFNATLWANEESIFNELELEDPAIYEMDNKVIVERVKAKTQEYITQITAEKPEPIQTLFGNG